MTERSRALRAALIVFAAAFVLRAGWLIRQGPPAPLAGDETEYHAYAMSLATTGRLERADGSRATRMPGYPVFLAAAYSVAGDSTNAVHWVQAALGAATCALVYLWALTLLRPEWALACGLAAAASYDLIAPSGWLLTETLYSFLLAGSFYVLASERPSGRVRAVVAGAGWSLTYLVRPEVLPFGALSIAASPWLFKRVAKRDAAWGLALFLAIASSWTVRNALVLRRFVPINTVSGFNRYLGLREPLTRLRLDQSEFYQAPSGANELERDAGFLQAFRELNARIPPRLKLKAYAFNLLTVYYPFLPRYDWTYALLVPFWLFGIWAARRKPELRPVAALVLGLSAAFAVLAGPVSRYRFGFAPALIILAGFGAQSLRDQVRNSKLFWSWSGVWAALNLILWIGGGPLRNILLSLKARIWS